MKINVVTDVINDVTYSCKSVNTCVVIRFLLHDIIHWKTATSYDKSYYLNSMSELTPTIPKFLELFRALGFGQ